MKLMTIDIVRVCGIITSRTLSNATRVIAFSAASKNKEEHGSSHIKGKAAALYGTAAMNIVIETN